MLCVFYKKKKIHCLWGVSFWLGAYSPVFNSLLSVLGGEHSGPSVCLLSSLGHWDTLFPGGLCFPLFLIFSPVLPSLSPPPHLFSATRETYQGLEIWLINLSRISEQGSGCNRCWQMDRQINTLALRWLLSWELRSLDWICLSDVIQSCSFNGKSYAVLTVCLEPCQTQGCWEHHR